MEQHIMLRWMEIHNKSVDDVASQVRCTAPFVRNMLARRRQPSLPLAKRLSDMTGGVVPMDAFLMPEKTEAAS
jgi:hypothetical protein